MMQSTVRCRIYIFGPLTVVTSEADGSWKQVERSAWGSNDFAPNVLKRLLSVLGRRLSRGQLLDDVWPGLEGDSLDNYLNRSISLIRKAIGGHDLITTWKGTYEIAGQDLVWVDADAAEALVTKAENLNDPVASVPLLEEALALFQRGIYLEQESGVWVHEVRRSYEILFKYCRLWLAEGYAALGKYLQASLQYQALLQAPWIDEETRRSCQERQALVETQGLLPVQTHWEPVVSLGEHSPEPKFVYDGLGVDILALAWRWKPSFGSIAILQQLFYEVIRKHTTMHNETRMNRRQVLQAIATFPLQVYGVKLFSAETVLLPSEEMLPLCAAGITACWELRQYDAEGRVAVKRILATYLPALEKLARQANSTTQRSAASLASQGQLLTSLLGYHSGNLAQVTEASQKARFYAQLAQDINLEVSALTNLATKFGNEHCDMKALETYQEARALPDFHVATPLLQGRIFAGLAGKYAACQQSSEALSYLSQAKEIYPREPELDPSYTFALTGPGALQIWEGITLEHVGRYTEAIYAYAQFGRLTPVDGLLEASRAELLIYIAEISLKQRDLEQAIFYLDMALTIAQTIEHQQRQREVQETFQDMQLLWPNEPKVKAQQEKISAR